MRKFDVIVFKAGIYKKPLVYKELIGQKAIKLMGILIGRGFTCVAETTANNITERLTIQEMKESVL